MLSNGVLSTKTFGLILRITLEDFQKIVIEDSWIAFHYLGMLMLIELMVVPTKHWVFAAGLIQMQELQCIVLIY